MAKRAPKPASPLDFPFTGEELIVVLHGKESFLQAEHTRRFREAVEERTGGEAESIRLDGKRVGLSDVLDELRSFGLMQQHKVVVVTDAGEFVKKHRQALERYAEAPVEAATLVLRDDTWNKGNLDKLIEKVGRIIKCEPPEPAEADAWLRRRSQDHYGVSIEPAAAGLLIDHVGTNLGLLDAELGKLAVSVPPGETIGTKQVQALAGVASDEAAWEIQQALLGGDAGRAVAMLHELIDLADNPRELLMFFTADLVRKLHHAAVMLGNGQNEFTVCSTLKVWPRERQKPFTDAAKRLKPRGAARLLNEIVQMDRRTKTGFSDGVLSLESFCLRFTSAIAAGPIPTAAARSFGSR